MSDSGLKQTCISEVSFASLVAMPESDSSLPKLSFPKENPRKKEKVCNLFINSFSTDTYSVQLGCQD